MFLTNAIQAAMNSMRLFELYPLWLNIRNKYFVINLIKRHVQKKYKVKQIIYDMITFYFKLSGTFPIVKNNCLQQFVIIFSKNRVTNHLRYNKVV